MVAGSGLKAFAPVWDISAGGLVCGNCAARGALRLTGAQVAWMRAVLKSPPGFATQSLLAKESIAASSNPIGSGDDREIFIALRRYIEARLEMTLKVSKLLP